MAMLVEMTRYPLSCRSCFDMACKVGIAAEEPHERQGTTAVPCMLDFGSATVLLETCCRIRRTVVAIGSGRKRLESQEPQDQGERGLDDSPEDSLPRLIGPNSDSDYCLVLADRIDWSVAKAGKHCMLHHSVDWC